MGPRRDAHGFLRRPLQSVRRGPCPVFQAKQGLAAVPPALTAQVCDRALQPPAKKRLVGEEHADSALTALWALESKERYEVVAWAMDMGIGHWR